MTKPYLEGLLLCVASLGYRPGVRHDQSLRYLSLDYAPSFIGI